VWFTKATSHCKKTANLTLYSLAGYSAHADQSMLVNWVKSMPEPPGEIRLVHGKAKAMQALSGLLNNVRK